LLCTMFLKEYSKKTGGISLSASHGKTYQSWLFSLKQSHSIYRKMEDLLRDDFKLLLIALNERRTSNSHAASSDNNDDDFKAFSEVVNAMK
jgi:hypothetical protein